MILNTKPSLPIPWNADEDEIVALLDASFGDTSSFDVEKQTYGLIQVHCIIQDNNWIPRSLSIHQMSLEIITLWT